MADITNILAALMDGQQQQQPSGGILGALMSPPTLLDQARQQYPLLKNYDIGYKSNVGGGNGYMESWPPGETGTASAPRPAEFPANQFGVENYRADSRPTDLAADVVSHHLVNIDPQIKQTYQNFSSSLEPWQNDILQQQYQHAIANEGEKRSFEDWKQNTGVPAYFRGYSFQQWPADFNKRAYTPQQMQQLDAMVRYLRSGR
jgi:hypothetical protein